MDTYKQLALLLCICCVYSCEHESLIIDDIEPKPSHIKDYVFLGHTYDWQSGGRQVDPRIESLDKRIYDEIWLGGDVCAATTRERETLVYLDGLFDLSSSTTHWAVGNHDIRDGNSHWVVEQTKRPLYYSHYASGITRIVVNTTIKDPILGNDCEHINGQVEMIKAVCDTIQHSSHLVLLMHYVLWLNCEADMHDNSAENANASWISLTCEPGNQFQHIVYPDLIAVQNRGIQVIVISGDSGQYGKKYEYTSADGIQFYMSGINNSFNMKNDDLVARFNTDPDSILIFNHNLETQQLVGKFYELNDL